MIKIRVTLLNGKNLTIQEEELGRGSTGTVYLTSDKKQVVKLYHEQKPELLSLLEMILTKYNCTSDSDARKQEYWNSLYLWPKAIIIKPKLGILLDKYPDGFKSLLSLFGPRNYQRLSADEKRWDKRLLVAWRLSQAVARMHQTGVAHSDLSDNNVRVNPYTGQLRIIDIDGLVVPGFVPPQVLGTMGYMAPEVLEGKAKPSITTDRHALAVMIYRLLLYDHPLEGPFNFGLDAFDVDGIKTKQYGTGAIYIHHPADRRNQKVKGGYPPTILGPRIAKMFEDAFVEGVKVPEKRPSAAMWKEELGRLADRTITCNNSNCVDKVYPIASGKKIACPWCGVPFALNDGLPVLQMYQSNMCILGYLIVGYPGRTLQAWHAKEFSEADPFMDQKPIAGFESVGRSIALINKNCPEMAILDRNGVVERQVGVGESFQLRKDMILRLGGEKGSRMALVQWIR